jgi:EAL domain-containing protein (putative c-di-GMP-specific phosphodiesterase class I)
VGWPVAASHTKDPPRALTVQIAGGKPFPLGQLIRQARVDLARKTVFAHEALVRGPKGEGAASVLAQVHDGNRYSFDQACRVKAIKGAKALGIQEPISINFLPNAIYKPEVCIRTTLEAARVHGFPLDQIIFEVTEGERIEDGPWFASILREYKRCGFKTAIDDFGAGYAGLKLLSDFQPDLVKIDMELIRGVETSSERDFLFDQGISLMQGYLFVRPAFRAIATVDPATYL